MRRRGTAALFLLAVLQGCFTAGVWGYELRAAEDPITGEDETALEAVPGEAVENLWFCILATPFALALDCVTLPIQALVYGWWDDDESSPGRQDDTWRSTHRDRNE